MQKPPLIPSQDRGGSNQKEYRMKITADMKPSWLVQRLNRPIKVDNPFSFGGGLRNGGLNEEAMGLLRGLFSFDYMGAAEFEFGAVPEALQGLARDADELAAFTIAIPLASVPKNWRDKSKEEPEGDAHLFVLCRHKHANEVTKRVTAWATGNERLKESTLLASTLRPHDEWDGRTVGWLELNNGFFVFADREMHEGTCRLFGVEVAAVSA